MRLTAITDELSQDFEHALDVLLEYDIHHAELRGLWGTNIADLSAEQVKRAQNALKERDMQVVALSTPFFKCDLDATAVNEGEKAGRMHLANPRGFTEQMQVLERCIAHAHAFETPYLRVFTFWRKEVLTPELEQRIIDAFEEPLKYAERHGVTLLLENEYACYIGTGEEAARVATKINSPHLQLLWDPGNAYCAEETPFPKGYELVKPWTKHMHIKDAITHQTPEGRKMQWCVIGTGEIDYRGHLATLKQDGYDGFLSLETHYVPTTGSGEGGKGTSEDGSRACLVALSQLIAEL